MFTLVIIVHVTVCILLIAIILIQRGHGGGLVETFSDFESMFGTKTNTFLTRSTTVLSIIFLGTCLALAFFSAKQSRSLLEGVVSKQQPQAQTQVQPQGEQIPQTQTQAPTQSQTQEGQNSTK